VGTETGVRGLSEGTKCRTHARRPFYQCAPMHAHAARGLFDSSIAPWHLPALSDPRAEGTRPAGRRTLCAAGRPLLGIPRPRRERLRRSRATVRGPGRRCGGGQAVEPGGGACVQRRARRRRVWGVGGAVGRGGLGSRGADDGAAHARGAREAEGGKGGGLGERVGGGGGHPPLSTFL
jgi:hypothetical protein